VMSILISRRMLVSGLASSAVSTTAQATNENDDRRVVNIASLRLHSINSSWHRPLASCDSWFAGPNDSRLTGKGRDRQLVSTGKSQC
jgi:hypothetical protein